MRLTVCNMSELFCDIFLIAIANSQSQARELSKILSFFLPSKVRFRIILAENLTDQLLGLVNSGTWAYVLFPKELGLGFLPCPQKINVCQDASLNIKRGKNQLSKIHFLAIIYDEERFAKALVAVSKGILSAFWRSLGDDKSTVVMIDGSNISLEYLFSISVSSSRIHLGKFRTTRVLFT